MNILYEDSHFFAIDKPAGHFVHPPERSPYPVPPEKICLYHMRKHYDQEVFPIHRLDAPTSGVVLFSFDRHGARELSRLFMERQIQKSYEAVVRGHLEKEGVIDLPLEILGFEDLQESRTRYEVHAELDLPFAVGKKYSSSRYTWVKVYPETGRWHQIRRHFDRIAHPLIGDIEHGDTYHNRFFRDSLGIQGLCLKATELSFVHPWTKESVSIKAAPCEKWQRLQALFTNPAPFISKAQAFAAAKNTSK